MSPLSLRRDLRRWIPQQHGAWALLVVPCTAGGFLGGFTARHAVLLPTWLLAYCAAHHVQQYVRLRRHSRNPRAAGRHLAPSLVFGAVVAGGGAALAAQVPWLLVAAVCAVPFFAVNTVYAARNKERALLNGWAAVVPACGMLLVSYRLGSGGLDATAWTAAAACVLYFGGTVLYVKTMIRERKSHAYRVASGVYHAVAAGVAAVLWPWFALPFAVFLVRALVLPARRLRIGVIGAIEVGCSLLLLAFLVLLP